MLPPISSEFYAAIFPYLDRINTIFGAHLAELWVRVISTLASTDPIYRIPRMVALPDYADAGSILVVAPHHDRPERIVGELGLIARLVPRGRLVFMAPYLSDPLSFDWTKLSYLNPAQIVRGWEFTNVRQTMAAVYAQICVDRPAAVAVLGGCEYVPFFVLALQAKMFGERLRANRAQQEWTPGPHLLSFPVMPLHGGWDALTDLGRTAAELAFADPISDPSALPGVPQQGDFLIGRLRPGAYPMPDEQFVPVAGLAEAVAAPELFFELGIIDLALRRLIAAAK